MVDELVDGKPAASLMSVEQYQKLQKYIKELENFVEEVEDAQDVAALKELDERIAKSEIEMVPWEEAQKWFDVDCEDELQA